MNTSITKFLLGRIVATPGALATLQDNEAWVLLRRHASGDWGDMDDHDKRANEAALLHGDRLFSAYSVRGVKLWIITEADRSVTTILLPEEY
jgi:hypothetical protein